ncbi:MAG: cytochrome c5 family protein, partial [Deltaproteobacteria bacterium]|nr:cytochrome c5 family protein [Deltaproteobacteria bacterium]
MPAANRCVGRWHNIRRNRLINERRLPMLLTVRPMLILVILTLLSCPAFADQAKGEGVYMNFCSSCHASGIAGAPKVGDEADWAPRIAQGMDSLVKRAIEGYQGEKGYMPAKGGH